MVGDAAGLVRTFKGKGITTAVLTGIRAAETILRYGISEPIFHHRYRPANRDIVQDLPYGRGMRLLTIFISRYGLLDPVLRAARNAPGLRAALFDAVSAHASYRGVLEKALRLKPIWAILRAMVKGRG
jgi:flavin-dependent dehydrogenase